MENELLHSTRGLRFLHSSPVFIALISVAVATALIIETYSVFSQTYDEAMHIACGLEWLDRGTYFYDATTPPLARVATAIFPYLTGARSQGTDSWSDGDTILERNGNYQTNLAFSRIAILPFFWLSCFLVWRFMARAFGDWNAAIAVSFLAFCPVVLGHSSVATTDVPLMAMFLWSLLALRALLENPNWSSAVVAGLVIALAT